MTWPLDVDPPPKILVLPPAAVDLGEAEAAIEMWEHYSRKRLDDTQKLTVRVMMAQTADARWAAATTGREMPRQNGKGDEIEVVELWGLVQRCEAILHTVHDAVLLATQTQQRMLGVLEGHADLRRLVKRKWQGTGQQMIEMHNGGVVWYRTRTGGGGRGVDDIDRLVVDEAQHATEEHLAAVSPTLLANENPQLNAMGTAAVSGGSDWWWRIRKRALVDEPGSFGYVGHTAETVRMDGDGKVVQESVDVADRALWFASNPAMAARRGGGLAFLEEQLHRLGPNLFAREHLGVWDPPDEGGAFDLPISLEDWAELESMGDERPSPVALSVTVSEDRKWAQIGLAGHRADGRIHVQVVQAGRGTKWLAPRLVELVARHRPTAVAVAPWSPAGSLIDAIESARPKVPLVKVSHREAAQACGLFEDAVNDGTLAHSGQPQVAASLAVADRRWSGSTWTWKPRGGADISPVWALTLALGALGQKPKPTSPRRATVLS